MDSQIILESPGKEHEGRALDFLSECLETDIDMAGSGGLAYYVQQDGYDGWLKHLEQTSNKSTCDRVPSSKFFAVRESDKKIVGMAMIRHQLDGYYAKYEGHIGYCVRPSQQGKGYATIMLRLLLEKARSLGIEEVLVTCDVKNIASNKTIKNNSGQLVEEISDSDWADVVLKYKIDVEKALHGYRSKLR